METRDHHKTGRNRKAKRVEKTQNLYYSNELLFTSFTKLCYI